MNRFWSKIWKIKSCKNFRFQNFSKNWIFKQKKLWVTLYIHVSNLFWVIFGVKWCQTEVKSKRFQTIQNHSLHFRCIIVKLSQQKICHMCLSVSWKASLMQWSSHAERATTMMRHHVSPAVSDSQIEINRLNAKTVFKIKIDMNSKLQKLLWFPDLYMTC